MLSGELHPPLIASMKASSRRSKRKTLDCWQNSASFVVGVPIELLATKIVKRLERVCLQRRLSAKVASGSVNLILTVAVMFVTTLNFCLSIGLFRAADA